MQVVTSVATFLQGTVKVSIDDLSKIDQYGEHWHPNNIAKAHCETAWNGEKFYFNWQCLHGDRDCTEDVLRQHFDTNVRPMLDKHKLDYDLISFGPTKDNLISER